MRATVAYGALTLTLVFVPSVAAAQTASPVALEWSAPRGCPDRDYVLAATTRILGQSKGARQAVTARASVSHVAHQRWQVSLTTRTGDTEGERTLEARSCQALADTVGLILALAASPETSAPGGVPTPLPPAPSPPPAPPPPAPPASDLPVVAPVLPPTASASTSGTAPPVPPGSAGLAASAPPASATPPVPTSTAGPVAPPPPAPPAGATTPPPTASAPAHTRPSRSPPASPPPAPSSPAGSSPPPTSAAPHHLLAGLSAGGLLGPLPSLALGGEAAVGVRVWHLRGEIAASYWGAQTTSLKDIPNASSRFSLVAGDVRAGYVFSIWHLDLVPTFVAELELSQASSNVSSPQSSSATWLSLGGGGWVYWSLTREVALRLGVDALISVTRPIFQVGDPTPANPKATITPFVPGAVGGKGTLGVEVHFL